MNYKQFKKLKELIGWKGAIKVTFGGYHKKELNTCTEFYYHIYCVMIDNDGMRAIYKSNNDGFYIVQ